MRLKVWKTKPTCRVRNASRRDPDSVPSDVPSTSMVPEEGTTMPVKAPVPTARDWLPSTRSNESTPRSVRSPAPRRSGPSKESRL